MWAFGAISPAMYIVQLLVSCSGVKDATEFSLSYCQPKCQANGQPPRAQLRLAPWGTWHTKEGKEGWGGTEPVHTGRWHRASADTRNSLQDPEMTTFCKMALRLSSGSALSFSLRAV